MEPSPLLKAWIVSPTIRDLLAAYAGAEREEPCGVLLGRIEEGSARILKAPQVPNSHPRPDRAFRIAPQDILEVVRGAREEGLTVVGFWHGHLEGPATPGEADIEGLEAAEALSRSARLLVILGAGAGRAPVMRAWTRGPEGPREIPLGA